MFGTLFPQIRNTIGSLRKGASFSKIYFHLCQELYFFAVHLKSKKKNKKNFIFCILQMLDYSKCENGLMFFWFGLAQLCFCLVLYWESYSTQ